MIYHTVLFRFKEDINQEQLDQVLSNLQRLKEMKQPTFLHVGKNSSDRGKNFSVVLVSGFESENIFKDYMNDDFHQNLVSDHVKPYLEEVIVGDMGA